MRFVVAIVLFLAALVTIGLGVAQRTVLAGPASFTAELSATSPAPLMVVDGSALGAFPGTQAVEITGDGPVFMAYGRTADVQAWVGEATHRLVRWDGEAQQLVSRLELGAESTVPNPAGSDLWVQEFGGAEELTRRINVPAGASLIIAADGTAAAPTRLSITWPLDNSAPWSGPLIIGGGVLLGAGLVAFAWALIVTYRTRGPRRKPPRLPRPPRPPQLKPPKRRKALEAAPEPVPTGRRRLFAAGALLGLAVLSGCTAAPPAVEPVPQETVPVDGAEDLPAPAVTEPQLGRIVERVVATVAEADEAQNADIAALRLDGPALAMRSANYRILKRDSGQAPLPPLPTGEVKVVLPQQNDGWPRTVFAVVAGEEATTAPVALMLIQDSPRANYRVHYAMTLEPNTVLPQVAAASIGAPRVPADTQLGLLAPGELAEAYGDILLNGDESGFAAFFAVEGDTLRDQIGAEYKAEFRRKLPNTAKIAFSNRQGDEEPIAFGTNDTGLLVAVELIEVERVTPNEAGAAINPRDSVRALVGKSQTTKGVEASYGVQLLFYVPPLGGESEQVELLGYSQGLVAAREL